MKKPTVRQRRLGSELRRLRERAGMKAADAGTVIGVSVSMMSRLESGSRTVHTPEALKLLAAYGVIAEDERERVLRLCHDAQRYDWFKEYEHLFFSASFRDHLALEPEATLIRAYEPQVVPGLLQTEAYARGVLNTVFMYGPEHVDTLVRIRMERRRILVHGDLPRFWAVLDESAVRRPVAGHGVLREQLRHLVDMAARPNVTLQLLLHEQVLFGNSPFTIVTLPEPEGTAGVFVESRASSAFLEEPDKINAYHVLFDQLQAAALSPDATVDWIAATAQNLEDA